MVEVISPLLYRIDRNGTHVLPFGTWAGVAVADMDGDQIEDLLVANFASSDVSTGFLAEQADALTAPGENVDDLLMAVAALSDERLLAEVMQISVMHRKMGGWRN